jgi:glycosyltransferase involved in cell wall biosynthesis
MSQSALGVVMPVHNEEDWVTRSVPAVLAAAERAGWDVDVVVVDDGSTDGTGEVLDRLAADGSIRVLHQPNRGRFEARRAGLAALATQDVLLVDARVLVDPTALEHVRQAREVDPSARVWNGHVEVASEGNPYAAFWSGVTKVGWRRYFAHPRPVRFGLADFNAYPKGTTMFLAPRETLLEAAGSFTSLFDDVRLASDDTRMLREVARVHDITIAPGFSCRYHGKDSLRKWARQGWFRGTTFVDGYLGDSRRATPGLVALGVAAAVAATLAVRRPRWLLVGAAAGSAAAAGAVRASGGTAREAVSVAGLLVPFAGVFGAGLVRGLLLARQSR